jgi:tRNA/tmRNA/rRNA uracil-C5-methylase (TrmA/RlmC/RlmD family)
VAASEIVTLSGFAHGGEAVGRLPDGRAVFVAHAIPGETVRVRITHTQKRWCRAELVEVLDASPDRVPAPCPYFGPGQCGGCRLQHIAGARQHQLLRQVVVDQLERVGHIADPNVTEVVDAGDYGYRNRARFGVTGQGALGFRRWATHDLIPIDRCLLLDEPTHQQRTRAGDQWEDVPEVEVRTATRGAAIVADPAGRPRLAAGSETMTQEVAGLHFRVSATSFFQSNTAGAAALVALVRGYAAVQTGSSALDLYCGVGLFAAALAADGAAVTAVESHPVAARDARANLPGAEVISIAVEAAVARLQRNSRTFDVVVLDPPRRGAGAKVVTAVAALATTAIVIVACDAATLARDAGTLHGLGWRLREATPVDQFAQTGHVEVVAVFDPPLT